MKRKTSSYAIIALGVIAMLLAFSHDGIAARRRHKGKVRAVSRKIKTAKRIVPQKTPAQVEPQRPGAVSIYNDGRIRLWASMALNNRTTELIASLKKDLSGKTPHPLAAHALYSVLTRSASGAEQVGRIGRIVQTYDAAEYGALITPEDGFIKSASTSNDPIMLAYVADAAAMQFKDALATELIADSLYLSQNQFIAARIAYELALRNPSFRTKLVELASPGNLLFRTPAGRFLSTMLAITPQEPADELVAIDDYLLTVPNDPGALYYRGAALASLNRHSEAAQALGASVDAYPYDLPGLSDRWTLYMKELEMGNSGGEVERATSLLASTYGNSSEGVRISKLIAIKADTNAGEFGAALKRLKELGSGRDVNRQYAVTLIRAGRTEEAVNRARAALAETDDASSRIALADALKAQNKFEEALKALGSKNDHLKSGTYGYYARGAELIKAVEGNTALLRFLEEGCQAHPGSALLQKELAASLSKDGRVIESTGALLKVVELGDADVKSIRLLRNELTKFKGKKDAQDELRRLRIAHPGLIALWDEEYEQIDGSDAEAALKLWKEAVRLNPLKYWPIKRIVAMLTKEGQLNEAAGLAQNAFLNGLAASDRAGALEDLAAIELEKVRLDPADTKSTESALKLGELYSKYHGNAQIYHTLRRTALLKAGRIAEAANEAFELSKINPDDEALVKTLVIEEQERLGSRPWMTLNRYVNRRPYEPARLRLAAGLHARHGGSALVSLILSNDLEKISREAVDEDARAIAYAIIGDNRAAYETRYAQAKSIAPNFKAISDFYSASEKAGGDSVKVVPDYSTGIFKIMRPDGTILERKDNPASARTEFIRSGSAYLRAQYDAEGDRLRLLEASSGERFEFNYDTAGRVTSIISTNLPALRFGYAQMSSKGAQQGPSVISMDGVGDVTLTYKQDGALESASSSKSRDVAPRVLAAFKSLTELLARFESGILSIPEGARQSAEYRKLRSAYEKSKRHASANAATLLNSARAGLAFAGHVKRKDAGSPEALKSAIEVSIEVISSLTNKSANKIIRKESTQNAHRAALAAEAIVVWHELIESTGRVTREDAAFLYGALTRLDEMLLPKFAESAMIKKLVKIVSNGYLLAPHSASSQKDAIFNEAAWKKWSITELAPPEIASFSRISSVIARADGDIVAALTTGISVFKGSAWQWYGFDPKANTFSSWTEAASLDLASSAIAIAEGFDKTLWIALKGREVRLVRMADRYDAKAQSIEVPDAWQISGISGLVPFANGVIAWNSTDARFYAPDGTGRVLARELGTRNIFSISAGRAGAEEAAIVATDKGLYISTINKTTKLADGRYTDAIFSKEDGVIYANANGSFVALNYEHPLKRISNRYALRYLARDDRSAQFSALEITVNGKRTPAMLSRERLSVFTRDGRFSDIGINLATGNGNSTGTYDGRRIFISSPDRIMRFDPGLFLVDASAPAYAIIHSKGAKRTFFARGARVDFIDDDSDTIRRGLELNATKLAILNDGRVLADNGGAVVAFDPASPDKYEKLFDTKYNSLTALISASDSSVWATAGPSVFRWDGSTLQEWSATKTPQAFPSKSDVIANIYEGADKKIIAIASDESAGRSAGISGNEALTGGPIEWNGSNWSRIDLKLPSPELWYVTGYTPVDSRTAVAATPAGFAFMKKNRVRLPENASYAALEKDGVKLFLGTNGIRTGVEGGFVFGSAGGLLRYAGGDDGVWSYPEKMNALLPGFDNPGARAIRALATDSSGRIFAGTGSGVLVYSPKMD